MNLSVSLEIPKQISELLNRLDAHSCEAYLVGKCVREMMLGKTFIDYDIVANAPIDKLLTIFTGYSLNTDKTRLGEFDVKLSGMVVNIASYRSGFDEHGLPVFTTELINDLARRAFSFNAIAYNPKLGLVDPFNGAECIYEDDTIIKVIGEDIEYEDDSELYIRIKDVKHISAFITNPVTILQALGYYSADNFHISAKTKESILKYKRNVLEISSDAIRTELSWVLKGKNVTNVLTEYYEVFKELVPEFGMIYNYDQRKSEHNYDLLTHTNKSVGYSSPILVLRYALWFHGLGKPDCLSVDIKGKSHFHGHEERSAIYARRIMTRLGFKNEDISEVSFLIKNHDKEFNPDRRALKLIMQSIPPERLKLLFQFKYADLKAKSPDFEGAAMLYKRLVDNVNEIIASKECYLITDLAINKYDLIEHGIVRNETDAEVLLRKLFDIVIDTPQLNSRIKLLEIAERAKKR